MRRFGLLIILCCIGFSASIFAQDKKKSKAFKLPNTIDNSDKRKVEKAQKLLNQGKLFEGEKLLLELRDENMYHPYFHEALIQIQKQILDFIAYERPPSDEDGEYFLQGKDIIKPEKNLEENFIDNGLSRTVAEKEETVDNIRLSRKDKRKLRKALSEKSETTIGVDTVLNPIEAAKKKIDSINNKQRQLDKQKKEKSKIDRKKAKKEDDILLIPYESYASDIVRNGRLATLKHERVDSSAHYLRILTIDTVAYDTILSANQLETMEEAMDYYFTSDFVRAAQILKKITAAEPDYFPAHYCMAKCFSRMGLDTPTYNQWVYIATTFDKRPEGLVGLSEYFLAKGDYKKANECILKAIMIYPEDAYFAQLNNILKRMGRRLNSQWIRREVYPINTGKNYSEIIAKEKSPWRYYQNAGSQVHSYASPEGILRGNEITNERYVELYAWKEMLKDHENEIDTTIKDPKKRAEYLMNSNAKKKDKKKDKVITFPFARSMQKMGYLDCYVFISLFHHDMYDAYKEFVLLNPDKVEKYFYILLNWEDKKFDKYRVDQKKEVAESSKKNKRKKKK